MPVRLIRSQATKKIRRPPKDTPESEPELIRTRSTKGLNQNCRSFSSIVCAAVQHDKALGAKRIGGHVRGQSNLLAPVKDNSTFADFVQALKKAGSVIPTDIISINVSGQIFRTTLCKLNRHPTTLLGNAERRAFFWSDHEQAFIFDRRDVYFQPIFDFYQTGNKIQRPEHLDLDSFLDELIFYEMTTTILEPIREEKLSSFKIKLNKMLEQSYQSIRPGWIESMSSGYGWICNSVARRSILISLGKMV